MPTTKQQRREIYWTAYCCLDGEECDLTCAGLFVLLEQIKNVILDERLPELFGQVHEWKSLPSGKRGWPARKGILLRAIELTY